MTRKNRFETKFGGNVAFKLAQNQSTQNALATATGKKVAYVNQTLTGRRPASPQWVDFVANVLGMTPEERQRLHQAAAEDMGYKLDLRF